MRPGDVGDWIYGKCPEDVKKVVFLDIDGVLQPFDSSERYDHMSPRDSDGLNRKLLSEHGVDYGRYSAHDVASVYYDWDKDSVAQLKRVLDGTGAKIVLSSSWREPTLNRMLDLFRIHGLHDRFIDVTPILWLEGLEGIQPRYDGLHERVVEILTHLEANPHIERYVVVDDMDLRAGLEGHFVWTGREGRLTREHADRCIRILNG